ncbi:hypothetical protein C0Q70_14356 [Pomacea canaliculata]|uniref:BRISC and BRCA1-A complex member 2 n=1 Tax=Pomacea canaliculata TaxID=400727 RepID=A0A2T7NZS7_POMCA|nr:BRISC and BRCA1-A complex member 2-like [Pomacea canaliculata]PVD26678.1 hypothetical protein C0Q70_14356 [Pomacea canaliculata]
MDAEVRSLDNFDPKIRHFVEYVMLKGEISMFPGSVNIYDAHSGCPAGMNKGRLDRFKMSIPYAGRSVAWEIIFDCTRPTEPPDFIFGTEHEDFLPPMNEIESLLYWDANRRESLHLLIKELLLYYKEHNIQCAGTNIRLQQDIMSLLWQANLKKDDFEVWAPKIENRLGIIHIVTNLNVDFSQLPAFLVQGNPGPDRAILTFSYSSPDSTRISPELHLSPKIEHALGGSSCLKIPSLTSGTLIGDYVICIQKLLKNKVTDVIRGVEKRKEYTAAFLSHFGRSVLEYDLETFSTMSFLFEWNDFFFTFTVTLPLYFPGDQPQFLFQSVYHESRGRPYFQIDKDFPYSPRWSANEMAVRAKAHILETIGKFQRASVLAKQK